MFCNIAWLLFLLVPSAAAQDLSFSYNGFQQANLSLDGFAQITSSGLLRLTNSTSQRIGHAFYPSAINLKTSPNGSVFSFSTTFVFAMIPQYADLGGHGIAFVISPQRGFPGAVPNTYLGLFNGANNGNDTNHVVAVELDTILSDQFGDINDNHVGIDINGLKSVRSAPTAYHVDNTTKLANLSLISGLPMQVWIEYDGVERQMNVSIAPLHVAKPGIPLLSLSRDLSPFINSTSFVGFSSATGAVYSYHYLLGWSFRMNGSAPELDLSELPKLPRLKPKERPKWLTTGLPIICVSFLVAVIFGALYLLARKRRFREELEEWELDCGPHRFRYKDLYFATKGFHDKELLGSGGFGKVYRGVLPTSKTQVAVKKVSHESRQGMKEFVAEIVSIGQLRHRNIVPLLGYCRRKGELLLIYDYMPNGSLDKYLHDQPNVTLDWSHRFQIIKGVASGLFHLHEGWEKVVIHRDVKASNVLLDGEFNGRLGDFGLARLYDHGTDPHTTHIVGTLGYLAPEHARTGKATKSSDVYAFGAFLLEVACGRRPLSLNNELILVDWVFSCWTRGDILAAKDPNMGTGYAAEELELVLRLGLLCSHADPARRPGMRQVVEYLEGDAPLPELSSLVVSAGGVSAHHRDDFTQFATSYPTSTQSTVPYSSSVAESLLSGGR